MLKCRFCKKDVAGQDNLARVYYRGDDSDDLEPFHLVHIGCSNAYIASISGKKHKCPKCEGIGTLVLKEATALKVFCDLCSGDGFLEKEPVPTSWKLG